MLDVEKLVLSAHTKLMESNGINRLSDKHLKVERENAIDSLGLVNLILDIEDELGIELDESLPSIRKCNTIGEIIDVVKTHLEVYG